MAVGAAQVGSYFVGQYYQVLPQHPHLVHQFYSDKSSMIRVDGDSIQTAHDVLQVHELVMSLNFVSIEIKTINSLDSWDGGLVVMVSGFVKIKDISGRRKFVQSFFLAPQEKGFFVLNDIFHFIDDGLTYPNMGSVLSEKYGSQPHTSNSVAEPHASDYGLEDEAREYVDSVHIEDDPVDKYSLPEHQQLGQDFETEVVVVETPVEEASPPIPSAAHTIYEPPAALVEEPLKEPPKKTWASILQVSKGQSVPSTALQSSFKSTHTTAELNHVAQPAVQQSSSPSRFAPDYGVDAREDVYGTVEEGEVKSVYVRNLPATVTEAEIEQEFKNFGRIKPDGIFIRVRQDIGVCYAFVDFEDILGVNNSLQASPIQLAGRQVYIEERRPNSGIAARGGRGRGRGRSSYQGDAPRGRFGGRGSGRGSYQDASDFNRPRGDGYSQRGAR
ncbi:putative RNA recognition motif domain, NTF2-like domain-containing protein [Lupinus albus]|uniref:Putative RNA recognition motif domain, NTF2-like domain-containing protein n=1 Tax=Lupinus albus TaxID=3870 RepID=A0A6A4NRC1_LUPAL|nr:putative RNA recognition motif domain, NTF2-like domain-containing protein [Lupinus albus]